MVVSHFLQFSHLTDTQTTHRPTDGIGNKPVRTPACTLLYYSNAANIMICCFTYSLLVLWVCYKG